MPPDAVPVIVYDGHCPFCVRQAARLRGWLGSRARFESFRDAGVIARHPGLTEEACAGALQLVRPDGSVVAGAAAVAEALRLRPVLAPVGWLYRLPLVRQLLDAGYRAIARNRFRLGRGACAGDACRVHDAGR